MIFLYFLLSVINEFVIKDWKFSDFVVKVFAKFICVTCVSILNRLLLKAVLIRRPVLLSYVVVMMF